jgi:hypothetical protein
VFQIKKFFNAKHILHDYQFGFRPNYSTSLALIEVIDNIYYNLDRYEFVMGLYLDFRKTFDTVTHDILYEILCDDINFFISSKSVRDLNHMANVLMRYLNSWLNDNKLHLSIEKTYYTVFTPSETTVDYEFDVK